MTRLLVAVLVFAGLVTGCANIPDRTPPKVVLDAPAAQERQVRKPIPDLDPLSVVQEFIFRAGSPDVARTYLTEEAKQHWPRNPEPTTILADGFKTPPAPVQETRPVQGTGPEEKVVMLNATQIGRLNPDRAFYPIVQPVEYRVVVQRQADGQWRISTPPDVLLIEQAKFDASYRRVNLQFFDPEQRVMVSDPRYVETEPREGLEARVMRLLLAGPSDSLKGAVRSQLDGVDLRTNVVRENDGAVLINLTQVDKSIEDRQRMAAQIVKSLSEVTTSPLRINTEGRALIPQHDDWRLSDVGSYDALSTPKPDLLGLVVAGRTIRSMRDGKPIEGPAGAGAYDIVSAAQSLDGSQLAVIQRTPTGMGLRIGKINGDLPEIGLPPAATLTRPTWLLGDANGSSEVWTVLDGTVVVRAVRTSAGTWEDLPVDASELTADGGTITQLRLSRDGVRVAAVVNGEIKVASVVRTNDAVAIRLPRTLQGGKVKEVIGVDWLNKVDLIVATELNTMPVASLPIDGLTVNQYNSTTLTLPVTSITAAPSRPAVVTDGSGMWSTQEAGKVWQAHQHSQGPGSVPFFPG